MCGIAGVCLPDGREVVGSGLAEALLALRHRGPDGEGTFTAPGIALGMRRLAIIDLVTGAQPVFNEDRSVVAVLNGEIYNYVELRESLRQRGHAFATASDTEVLVHLYEDEGEALCSRLRGMFAFAIWDGRARTLLLARDRFGKKPLYVAPLPGGLAFASELKGLRPLLRGAGAAPRVREQGIYDYLSLGAVPQPDTVYEGVSAVGPGRWLRFDGERIREQAYWRPELEPKTAISYADAQEELRRTVGEAVRLRLRSDVPVGVFLSGGVDSSVVAYEAARHLGGGLRTFTVSVADAEMDEAPVARRTAAALGVENVVLPLHVAPRDEVLAVARHFDQPFADPSAIPSLAVARLAREHVKVVLNGDGGDEVCGGYRRYLAARTLGRIAAVPGARPVLRAVFSRLAAGRRRSAAGLLRRFGRGLALGPGARYLVWTKDLLLDEDKRRVWRGRPQRATEAWVAERLDCNLAAVDAQIAGDIGIELLSSLLVKMDMATMAASLEGRSPFLDHEVAQFALRLPVAFRVRGARLKAVLRDAYRDRLPREVIEGRKRGFEVPLAAWLDGDLRDLVGDALLAPDARIAAYVEPAFVRAVVEGAAMRERNRAGLVYALLMLELWLRESRS
ncbi:MAG: asparagine synthase (glutamine-hydrolyzing) [Acidobacteria bacterium 21-70-11]|nr:MAG: asparagine synthase (glutamine-hydrolyzing) [Acidobacteria bacterium 21-70-11]